MKVNTIAVETEGKWISGGEFSWKINKKTKHSKQKTP